MIYSRSCFCPSLLDRHRQIYAQTETHTTHTFMHMHFTCIEDNFCSTRGLIVIFRSSPNAFSSTTNMCNHSSHIPTRVFMHMCMIYFMHTVQVCLCVCVWDTDIMIDNVPEISKVWLMKTSICQFQANNNNKLRITAMADLLVSAVVLAVIMLAVLVLLNHIYCLRN